MKHLTPAIYTSLGSLATLALVVGLAIAISPSKASGPYQARGSGREPLRLKILQIETRIDNLIDDLADQEQQKEDKNKGKTEIAKAHQGATMEKGPTAPPPGGGRREDD